MLEWDYIYDVLERAKKQRLLYFNVCKKHYSGPNTDIQQTY